MLKYFLCVDETDTTMLLSLKVKINKDISVKECYLMFYIYLYLDMFCNSLLLWS